MITVKATNNRVADRNGFMYTMDAKGVNVTPSSHINRLLKTGELVRVVVVPKKKKSNSNNTNKEG